MTSSKLSLEDRIRAIEDRLEIYNLIAAHPFSADTGARDYTETVWTEDGVFDRGPLGSATGRTAVAAGLASPGHQAAIKGGIAHFAGLPHIAIDGDKAVVTSYLQILVPQTQGDPVEVSNHGTSKGHRVHRVVANHWELVRTGEGWKFSRRELCLIDGADRPREIARQALK